MAKNPCVYTLNDGRTLSYDEVRAFMLDNFDMVSEAKTERAAEEKPMSAARKKAEAARKKAEEIRKASGGTLMSAPKLVAAALDLYATLLEKYDDISKALNEFKKSKEYTDLSDENKKIVDQEIGDEETVTKDSPKLLASVAQAFIDSKMEDSKKDKLLSDADLALSVMSFDEMEVAGQDFIDSFDNVEDAVESVRALGKKVPDTVFVVVYGKAMEYARKKQAEATTTVEKDKWADYETDLIKELTEKTRSAGRMNAYIQVIYGNNPYQMVRETKKVIDTKNKLFAPEAKQQAKGVKQILDGDEGVAESVEQAIQEAVEASNKERDQKIKELEATLASIQSEPKKRSTNSRKYKVSEQGRKDALKTLLEFSANPFLDPRKWQALGTLATYHLERGYYKFEDFYKKMKKELKGEYEDYYADLYNEAAQQAMESGIAPNEFSSPQDVEARAQEIKNEEERIKAELARQKELKKQNSAQQKVREALIKAGFSKEVNGKTQVDWKKLTTDSKDINETVEKIKSALSESGITASDGMMDLIKNRAEQLIIEKKKKAIETRIKQINRNKLRRIHNKLKRNTRIDNLLDIWKQGGLSEKVILEKLGEDFGFISFSAENEAWIENKIAEIDKAPVGAEKELLEEQLQAYLEDLGAPLISMRRILETNKARLLSGPVTAIKNLTGAIDAAEMVIYKTMTAQLSKLGTKGVGDKEILKVVKKAHTKALYTYLDILVNGGVDLGTAMSETTGTKEGSPRVRYMENQRRKWLKPYIKSFFGKDVNVNVLNWEKYPQRFMAAVDAISQTILQETETYTFIKNDLMNKNPNMSAKEASEQAYEIAFSVDIEDAIVTIAKEFDERGISIAEDTARFNRRVQEYIEQQRPKEATLAGQKFGSRYTYKHTEAYSLMNLLIAPLTHLRSMGSMYAAKLKREAEKENNPVKYRAAEHIENGAAFTFDWLFPFVKGVGNILEKGFEHTAYGYFKSFGYGAAAAYMKLRKIDNAEATFERAGEYAYRATIGSLVLALIMSMIDDEDEDKLPDIYGEGSTNMIQNMNQMIVRPQNTLKIGGKNIPIEIFGPYAAMLRLKAYEVDKLRYEENKHLGVFMAVMASDMYLDQTANMLKAVKQVVAGQDEKAENYGKRQFAELVTRTFIPFTSAMRQAEQFVDPKSKKPITLFNHLEKQSGVIFGWVNGSPKAVDFMGNEYDVGQAYTGGVDGLRKMFSKAKEPTKGELLVLKYNPAMTQLSQNDADLQIPDENYVYAPIGNQDYFEVKVDSQKKFGELVNLWAETNPESYATALIGNKEFTPKRQEEYSKLAKAELKASGGDPEDETQVLNKSAEIFFNEMKDAAIKDVLSKINSLSQNAAIENYYIKRGMKVPLTVVGSIEQYNNTISELKGGK